MKFSAQSVSELFRTYVNPIYAALTAPVHRFHFTVTPGLSYGSLKFQPSENDVKIAGMIGTLFNAQGSDTAQLSINEFLNTAVKHYETRTGERMNGLDFGEMTYLFTTPTHPHYALLVSYDQKFVDEFRDLCRDNNDVRLTPTIAAEKSFMCNTIVSPGRRGVGRVTARVPQERALLLTNFGQLRPDLIKSAGLKIDQAIPIKAAGALSRDVAYTPHRDPVFYDHLVEKLLSAAHATSVVSGFKHRLCTRMGLEKPVLMAA